MKTIQTKSGEVLLIKVPEDATDFKISSTNYLCFLIEDNWEADVPRLQSNFKIIDKFSELEDKSFEEFVKYSFPFDGQDIRIYENYDYTPIEPWDSTPWFKTAKESFQSLCRSQGIEDNLDNYLIIKKI